MSGRTLADGSILEVPDDSVLEEWITHTELCEYLNLPEKSPMLSRCPRVIVGQSFRLYNKRTVALWLKSMEKVQSTGYVESIRGSSSPRRSA